MRTSELRSSLLRHDSPDGVRSTRKLTSLPGRAMQLSRMKPARQDDDITNTSFVVLTRVLQSRVLLTGGAAYF
eukprot:2526027-Pleurochrysis_carterae.AAC.4